MFRFAAVVTVGREVLEWEKIIRRAEGSVWTQTGGVFSSSVEYHTRLSSGGVEDPVV